MMTRYDILFLVEMGNIHFLCYANDREDAKRQAHRWMGADPDKYIVSPLTEPGDRVRIEMSLSI
jgi:hypothetical protein